MYRVAPPTAPSGLNDVLADLERRVSPDDGVVLVHIPLPGLERRVRAIVVTDRLGATSTIDRELSAADARRSFAAIGARRSVRWGSCDAIASGGGWTALWTLRGEPFRLWDREGVRLVVFEDTLRGRAVGGVIACGSVLEVRVRRRWFGHWSVVLRTAKRDLHLLSVPPDSDDGGVPGELHDLATRLHVALGHESSLRETRGA